MTPSNNETPRSYQPVPTCSAKSNSVGGQKGSETMNEQEVLRVLDKVGAVIDGHFVYASGRHGKAYFNKDAVYPHTQDTSCFCREIAKRFLGDRVEVVIAPAIGGLIISQWTAHHLTEMTGREVFSVYADKSEQLGSALWYICFGLRLLWKSIPQLGQAPKEYFAIKRGYDKFIAQKNVLVVEDILTTGRSAKKVIKAARAIGGNVIGLGAICNRGGIEPQDVADVPKFTCLVDVKLDAWDEADCPLCDSRVPINTDVGKGKEFLARRL